MREFSIPRRYKQEVIDSIKRYQKNSKKIDQPKRLAILKLGTMLAASALLTTYGNIESYNTNSTERLRTISVISVAKIPNKMVTPNFTLE